MMLSNYEDFVRRVDELGMISFWGKVTEGFPRLQDETSKKQWFTGDPETDPWMWKDRCAAEKRLAFGSVLGGVKGFISPDMYPYFFAACKPKYTIEERYFDGKISPVLLEIYRMFEGGETLSAAEIRKAMGVSRKSGSSKEDAALVTLQMEFHITICGNRQKRAKDGHEYGWPSNAYCLAEPYFEEWLSGREISKKDAREFILSRCASWGNGLDAKELERVLFRKV